MVYQSGSDPPVGDLRLLEALVLAPPLISLMRRLDYSVPLGGVDADAELHSLLDKIENVDWDSVPRQHSSRSFIRQRPSFSPGRSHRGAGDYAWFNPWAGSQCSCDEARLSRQYGSQTPVLVEMPVFSVDPRERDLCPREPLRSRPVSPVSPTSLPADTADPTLPVKAPMRATEDPVRMGSKSPFRSHSPPVTKCQPLSETREVPSSASRTESLPMRAAPEREEISFSLAPSDPPAPSSLVHVPALPPCPAAVPVATPVSQTIDAVQSTRGGSNSPSSPDVIKKNDDAASVYRTLLRAHGIHKGALRGASLADLRVLAQLVASLPKEKILG